MHAKLLAASIGLLLAIFAQIQPASPTAPPPQTAPPPNTPTGVPTPPPDHPRGQGGGWGKLIAPDDLVTFQRGNIPIILSAPHGGQVRIAGSKDREHGVLVRDTNVGEIALLVSQRITAKLGGKPYFVIAQFSRKDADPNRGMDGPVNLAYENDAAKAQYEAYHRALRASVDDIRTNFPTGAILIDFHRQKRVPEAIVRGTRNGESIKKLVAKFGKEAVTGKDSLFGRLAAAGYTVMPALDDPEAKESFFDGGFITEHYGSSHDDGIDAIQMEIGKFGTDSLEKFSTDAADAIIAFYESYIKPGK